MYETKFVEKIKTHISGTIIFFFSQIVPFMRQYEKKIVEQYRPQMEIWRMRVACCIPKTTYTRTEYVMLFPMQQRLHERA